MNNRLKIADTQQISTMVTTLLGIKKQVESQTQQTIALDINQIGILKRELERIKTEMNGEIAKVVEFYTDKVSPIEEQIKQLSTGVNHWCEQHRNDLTENGKTKTVKFLTGSVQWRKKPDQVLITDLDLALKTLKKLKLTQFFRVKYEINKRAILDDLSVVEKIDGLVIKPGDEDFTISPFEN